METMTTTSDAAPHFTLAAGYIAVLNVSLEGSVRDAPELSEFYKTASYLKQRIYYLLGKHGVNTPFGYFLTAEGISEIKPNLDDVERQARQTNSIAEGAFRIRANVIFTSVDPTDPVLCGRLCEYVIETLTTLKQKILNGSSALKYTQDPIHRLHLFCTGEYRNAVLRAYSEVEDLKDDDNNVNASSFRHLDACVALFARAAAERMY